MLLEYSEQILLIHLQLILQNFRINSSDNILKNMNKPDFFSKVNESNE